jgi:hypothetical protein
VEDVALPQSSRDKALVLCVDEKSQRRHQIAQFGARVSSIPVFSETFVETANKATAWPPCSWVELEAVLDRPEFWVRNWLGFRHQKRVCTENLQPTGAKVSTPDLRANEPKLSPHFKGLISIGNVGRLVTDR